MEFMKIYFYFFQYFRVRLTTILRQNSLILNRFLQNFIDYWK
jgi:hypothetical protein